MELYDIYDNQGQDGKDNKEAFEELPIQVQYFFASMQKSITQRVENEVRKKFGQAGINDLKKSSGFRSYKVNTRWGGVPDSLHLFSCASDYRKYGIFARNPIPVPSCLECIDSGDCWHVQMKRGK